MVNTSLACGSVGNAGEQSSHLPQSTSVLGGADSWVTGPAVGAPLWFDAEDSSDACAAEPAASPHAGELTYGELAVALYASDMPTAKGSPAPAEIAAWAGQGLDRLGPARVWELDYRGRRAVGRDPEYSAVWPSPRRAGAARALAYRYLRAREAEGHVAPLPSVVYAEVAEPDSGATWRVAVLRRDVESARRWGWPLAYDRLQLAELGCLPAADARRAGGA